MKSMIWARSKGLDDEIAISAMEQILYSWGIPDAPHEFTELAEKSYKIADALLNERKRREEAAERKREIDEKVQ